MCVVCMCVCLCVYTHISACKCYVSLIPFNLGVREDEAYKALTVIKIGSK